MRLGGGSASLLVGGERDPEVLADLAKGALRRKIPELRQALHGRFTEHHALLIGLCLEHTTHLETAIARIDERVDAVFATQTCPPVSNGGEGGEGGVPFAQARDRLDTITGVGNEPPSASSPRSGWT